MVTKWLGIHTNVYFYDLEQILMYTVSFSMCFLLLLSKLILIFNLKEAGQDGQLKISNSHSGVGKAARIMEMSCSKKFHNTVNKTMSFMGLDWLE